MGEPGSEREGRILAMAELTLEAQTLGEAALISDWDEARFRSVRINDLAFALGSQRVAQAARDVTRALGPAERTPRAGCGAEADTLSRVIAEVLEGHLSTLELLSTRSGIAPYPL